MLAEPYTGALLPTRRSLLSRLRDWLDQAGWREFFETYWRLIYRVARKSGLNDAEAEDVVQNTFLYLARRMPGFRYDSARGSFKSWLRVVTRSRISEYRRQAAAEQPRSVDPLPAARNHAAWEETPDPATRAIPSDAVRVFRRTASGTRPGATGLHEPAPAVYISP